MWTTFLICSFANVFSSIEGNPYYSSPSRYIFWPNATVPFYIQPEHFDHEQSLSIMSTLALFALQTCLKFSPVLTPPGDSQHVMVLENPHGIRKCVLEDVGHPREEPYRITLGYECLKPPQIFMIVMKALGFTFEHNRNSRDLYIDVQLENIDPSSLQLFVKDPHLPMELQSLPYDMNSVMHFGDREYSKNGHRTIIFKDRQSSQNRMGLTPTDIKKIEIVYGSECRKRDRQEKIYLCQHYPGVVRRKRNAESYPNIDNLRVNRVITPLSEANRVTPLSETSDRTMNDLIELDIDNEIQAIADQVYKVSSKVLRNTRAKYCNSIKTDLRTSEEKEVANSTTPDAMGIIKSITIYAEKVVLAALANLEEFCIESKDNELYQRTGNMQSTKLVDVRYSTQQKPFYYPLNNNVGGNAGQLKPFTQDVRSFKSIDNSIDGNDKKWRKRESDKGTPIVSRNDDNKYNNINDRDKVMKRDDAEENTTIFKRQDNVRKRRSADYASENEEATIETDETVVDDSNKNRYNKGHRYRIKGTKPYKVIDWDDSNCSLEKTTKREITSIDMSEAENVKKFKRHRVKPKRKGSVVSDESQIKDMDGQFVLTVKLTNMNKEFYNERKWDGGVVPYIIQDDPNYDTPTVRKRIEEVNDILKRKTCVKLQEITATQAKKYTDYLVIDTSADYVTGRVGGRQNFGCLELFIGGQHRQHGAMMVMAMLGFYFEIARHDRDKYIRVHSSHVRPDKLHHFEKIRSDATLPLPYDYKSATHPAWQYWRKIGKIGIASISTYKSLDPIGETMKSLGHHSKLLSNLDLVKINSVYGTKCFAGDQKKLKEEVRTEAIESCLFLNKNL